MDHGELIPGPHKSNMRVFGIDFGSQRCVVASSSGEIVLNELGSMTTATLVSFKGDERLVGEAAVLSSSTNPLNTVEALNLLLGKQQLAHVKQQTDRLAGERVSLEVREPHVVASVDYMKQTTTFTVEQLTGMLLGKLAQQMKTRTKQQGEDEQEQIHVIVAVPSAWGESELRSLKLASKIAGIPRISVVSRDSAAARCFHRKHPLESEGETTERHIAIVDVGHTSTSVSVVKLTPEGETVLSTECDVLLGSENFDRHLFGHFQREMKEKHQLSVEFQTKYGKRLLQACEKLKKLLSTIGEAAVTVENIAQDRDVGIKITRDTFEQLCASESERITALVTSALTKAQVASESISSVEIIGGGTRIPFVQRAILDAFPLEQQSANLIGRMLDSTTAIAVGAAFGEDLTPLISDDLLALSEEQEQLLAEFVALEQSMQARDAELAAISHERNAIEAFIYEMRSKRDGKHGGKLDYAALNPLLDAAEDWIYSEEAEVASLSDVRTKREAIESEIRGVCKPYFVAVEQDEKALEAHLEEESKKAEAERGGEDEDHDTRKLKKPERMRLVVKNKEEGNELFRDGNHQHAAMRYIKALTHASKFFDLTEKDTQEVNALKLSLYLNLAQCYLKMEAWAKVIANCKEALVLDPANVKALYRRAMAYDKEKQLELAVADVKQALLLAPEDKAIRRLDDRLRLLTKKQLDKEKKMWSKAFA